MATQTYLPRSYINTPLSAVENNLIPFNGSIHQVVNPAHELSLSIQSQRENQNELYVSNDIIESDRNVENKPSAFNTTFNVLATITSVIKNDNINALRKLLLLIPFEHMNVNTANKFFSRYMYECAYYRRSDCLKYFYEKWNLVYPPNEKISLFTMMILMPLMDITTLSFIAKVYNDEVNALETMYELISYDADPYLPIACQKTIDIFGNFSNSTYGLLATISNRQPLVYIFVANKYRQRSPFAKIPIWMKDFTQVDSVDRKNGIPLESVVPLINKEMGEFYMPNIQKMARLLSDGIQFEGGMTISIDQIEQEDESISHFISLLAASTQEERLAIIKPIMELRYQETLQSNVELFRNSGPSNPLIDTKGDDLKFRGCRMFTCTAFDYSKKHELIKDWFVGYCYQCNLRIQRRWNAVRIPGEAGGWYSCLCSWDCARHALDEPTNNPQQEPRILSHQLINIFEQQIMKIGIQDRIPDNEKVADETSKTIINMVNDSSDLDFRIRDVIDV